MNQLNALHGDELTEPPRERNRQPPEVCFKSCTPTTKTIYVLLDIMGRLNQHAIDNGDVAVKTSDYPLYYTSDSVPDPDNTSIKSVDDY